MRQLFDRMINSRRTIARTYDIQSALTPGGNIDAVKMARIADKRPLSGELADIAHFGAYFEGAARVPTRVGSRLGPRISKTEIGAGLVTGLLGPGGWKGLAKEAITLGSPVTARSALGSKAYQNTLKPKLTTETERQAQRILSRGGVLGGPQAMQGLQNYTLNGEEEQQK